MLLFYPHKEQPSLPRMGQEGACGAEGGCSWACLGSAANPALHSLVPTRTHGACWTQGQGTPHPGPAQLGPEAIGGLGAGVQVGCSAPRNSCNLFFTPTRLGVAGT